MKEIYILGLLFLLGFNYSQAQNVYIPDANFRSFLQLNYPDCMVGDSLNTMCAEVINEQSLIISSEGISDLSGIEFFTGLENLNCDANQLIFLPALPSTLRNLECWANNLTSLPVLPAHLETLSCHSNQLSSLPLLPNTLRTLDCNTNLLTTIPNFPPLLQVVNCSYNQLTILPALNEGLETFYCSNNELQCLPFLPNSLTYFAPFGNNIICIPNVPQNMDTTGYNIPICSSNNIHNCSYYPPVSGYAYYDVNDDCVFDQNETGLSGRVIQLDDESYAITDSSGYYFSVVDTGEHTINQVHDNLLWDIVCPGIPYNVDFTAYSDSASNINFPNSALENCSWLWVDIASPFQRRCFQNTYRVDYCNRGTVAESNAFIEITFETEVIPLSSSLPWSSVSGNTYRFDIGYLDVEDCGWFTITDSISCDAFIGQTACATAIIYPVSPCLTGDNGWDNSSIQATGKCTGNSNIEFVLKNTGTGNMAGQSFYRIFEDNVLITANGAFQLSANDSIVIPISASGKTYRIEAEQRSGHPGNSLPRASVEYCGNPQFSQGQITAVAEDDADDYIETDCKVIIASYDPNDKTVIPSGIGTAHYIKPDDFLEYMIRFQNTGTDTAFTVEIVDTLANLVVDPLTFESGAASHPYSVSMRGNGIITWRFANILLPDSNVNEMASHGFIKYKIKQRSGNVNGTVVNNTAHIYFDYNAAIVTNTSSVTISDTLILPGMNEMNNQNDVTILVYPNPFSNETTLEIKTALIYKKGVVELRDGFGRLLNSYSISTGLSHVKVKRNNLSAGLYFYSVILDDRITSNGKLVIQN